MTKSCSKLATQLITRQAKPFKPAQFSDKHAVELLALLAKKAKRQKIEVPSVAASPQGNLVNIMDALKKSLKVAAAPAAARKWVSR
jgi:non-homologous end joining protein Ku